MKEKPIIFSTPMVKAILDGKKTMTRRIIKPQPPCSLSQLPDGGWTYTECPAVWKCPFDVGMILWVKETFTYNDLDTGISYKASYPIIEWDQRKWKPSIFMSRKFSRISLEITDIRVERLTELSEEDAIREGVNVVGKTRSGEILYRNYFLENNPFKSAIQSFQTLWRSIHKNKILFNSAPYVWVISFRRTK